MTTLTKPRKESRGGVIEFPDLEPGTYTAEAEAWNTDENILEGSGSAKITVKAGETTDCNITMILEGQTAYYSKYMILTDYSNIKKLYNYTTMQEIYIEDLTLGEQPYNPVEDREGKIYYIRDDTLHRNDEQLSQIDTSNLIKNPLYYDSKTDTYWIGLENVRNFYLQNSVNSYDTSITRHILASKGESFLNFAIQENKAYLIYIEKDDPIPNIIYYTKDENVKLTRQNGIQLSTIGVSGKVTDMAVLEDGTVAVLVRSVGVGTETEGFDSMLLNDKDTVYSRGALVLLSSDLSTYKVYGWTDSPRTISAKLNSDSDDPYNGASGNSQIASITAYIPEYAGRNSHFYGPMRIVAIRPKELVIADCGANFVLPDYNEKKNGKMFTHNRLMTVNLRNFAIDCKKEFSEDELKFQNLTISGNLESVTAGWTNLSAENEK